tara:strand:+ start:205 stop:399 length:195 start_codon:yes stop_codon:yes gene_type:complete
MKKFFKTDEIIEERFWRIWRNFESYTEKQISDMTIEEMKEVLDWLDNCYLMDLSILKTFEGEEK